MSYGLIKRDTLTGIADAIRSRYETEDTYTPSQMADAVRTLDRDFEGVYFCDHDGTILYSFWWDEVEGLTALPDLPSWENEYTAMTCTGWNMTLEEILSCTAEGVLTVGALYAPSDGNTHLFVGIGGDSDVSLYLKPDSSDTVLTIDWGDDSQEEVSSDGAVAVSHDYGNEEYTEYEITISVSGGTFGFYGDQTMGSMGQSTASDSTTYFRRTQLLRLYASKDVDSVGYYAFHYCVQLKEASFPGISGDIGARAFYYCAACPCFVIPEGVTGIGTCAFCGCYSASAICLPEGVTEIGTYAFCYCDTLRHMKVPESLTSIGQYAFSYCYSLESLCLESAITKISSYVAFFDENIRILFMPDAVTSIGDYAFYNLVRVKKLELPSELVTIGADAFRAMESVGTVLMHDKVETIGDYAFYCCYDISGIDLPETLTQIGDYAFGCCYSLEEVSLPESLETIGSNAFRNCCNLKEISIPEGVTDIGSYTFYCCTSLSSFYAPAGCCLGEYLLYTSLNLTDVTLPEDLTTISPYMFNCCYALKEISIPDTVETIGDHAFLSCYSLQSIVLPASLSSIGSNAFASCVSLKSVDGLYKPADETITTDFYRCYSLTDLTNVREINSSVKFAYSPLTYESVMNLFNALSEENTGTVTLSEESYALLDDDDLAVATDKGWTVTSA